jgi:hypothetical protein
VVRNENSVEVQWWTQVTVSTKKAPDALRAGCGATDTSFIS